LIAQLAEKLGLSQAGVIELSVRKLANGEGIKATEGKETGTDGE
jgi:hypothetical protein